jgi:hypothetical protein
MSSEPSSVPPPPYKNRRSWLIAFGVAEILIASFLLLCVALMAIAFLVFPSRPFGGQTAMSPLAAMIVAAFFYGGAAAFFLTVGIGSIRCRNWARILMLVGSSLGLALGVFATLFIMLLFPALMRQQGRIPPEAQHGVLIVMIAVMGSITVLMPVVFLVFYSRKSVKATCLASRAGHVPAPATSEPPKPRLPTPVLVLALWEGLGAFAVFAFLMVRATVVFGVVLHGAAAFLMLCGLSALAGSAAWFIYHRRLIGWYIALFKVVLGLASTITTLAGHNIMQLYREMGLSEAQLRIYERFPQLHAIVWDGSLLAMTALLGFILYTRKFFLPAPAEPAPPA